MKNVAFDHTQPDDTKGIEAHLTLAGAARLAAALHGSLALDGILRGCRRVLAEHLDVARVSLAQRRGDEAVVTIYSQDGEGEDSPLKPTIRKLESSRLHQSITLREKLVVQFAADSDQDKTERKHLLSPDIRVAIYLPLTLDEIFKGVLVLGLRSDRLPSAAQLALLDYSAAQLARALDNSDTHYLERRRGRQLMLISEIAKKAVVLEDLGEFLQASAEQIRMGFDYDAVQIWTLSERQESLKLRAFAVKDLETRPIGQTLPAMADECRRLDRSLCSNDLLPETDDPSEPRAIASHMVVPIRMRGKFLGVLSLDSQRLDAFSAEDLSIMEGLASLIATAFDTIRLFENAQQSNEYLQAILDSARDVAILSTDINGYVVTSSAGSLPIFNLTRKVILGRDLLTLFTDTGFQTELAVFLANPNLPAFAKKRVRQERDNKESAFFDVTLQRVLDTEKHPIGFLCIVRDVSQNLLLQERLEKLSITDELTGLYNQRRFFDALEAELERSGRYRRHLALCFLDLDGFKGFNDTQGHIQGDQALKDTAQLLRDLVRSGVDSCFRYGGDEFTIIMPETTKSNAWHVAERIRVLIDEHFQGRITASIGIAESSSSVSPEALVAQADKAMYRSKAEGGNRITVDPEAPKPADNA